MDNNFFVNHLTKKVKRVKTNEEVKGQKCIVWPEWNAFLSNFSDLARIQAKINKINHVDCNDFHNSYRSFYFKIYLDVCDFSSQKYKTNIVENQVCMPFHHIEVQVN